MPAHWLGSRRSPRGLNLCITYRDQRACPNQRGNLGEAVAETTAATEEEECSDPLDALGLCGGRCTRRHDHGVRAHRAGSDGPPVPQMVHPQPHRLGQLPLRVQSSPDYLATASGTQAEEGSAEQIGSCMSAPRCPGHAGLHKAHGLNLCIVHRDHTRHRTAASVDRTLRGRYRRRLQARG